MAQKKKIDISTFDKLPVKEQRKLLGLGRPIPKSAWRREVRNMSAAELLRIHRDIGIGTRSHQDA